MPSHRRSSRVRALPVESLSDAAASTQLVCELAGIDGPTAGLIAVVLRPALTITMILMVVRIVLSWFPEEDAKKFPWVLAYTPTEPVLGPTRKLIQPINGVDISPIVWVALLSLLNEILLGPQGILNLIQRQAQL